MAGSARHARSLDQEIIISVPRKKRTDDNLCLTSWTSLNKETGLLEEVKIRPKEVSFLCSKADHECAETIWDVYERKKDKSQAYLWEVEREIGLPSRKLVETNAFNLVRSSYRVIKPQYLQKRRATSTPITSQESSENSQDEEAEFAASKPVGDCIEETLNNTVEIEQHSLKKFLYSKN